MADIPFLLIDDSDHGFRQTLLQLFKISDSLPPYHQLDRLGFYYQWLISESIRQSTSHDIIAEEVQLIENKRTVGAIDFLVRNKSQQQIEHWEVAIKFYLHHEGSWLGPNAKDSLIKKVTRMKSHQLKLCETTAYKNQHAGQWGFPVQTRAIIQGFLFHHINEPMPALPAGCDKASLSGLWAFAHEIDRSQWRIIHKTQWLSLPEFNDAELIPTQIERPYQCINKQKQRLFLVPDQWPSQ